MNDPNSIRAKRLALNLSQRDFGAILGVTATTVSNWENKRAHPEPRHLRKLEGLSAAGEAVVLPTPFRPIQYLGSKARLAAQIAVLLDELAPGYETVADLYSGSAVVSGVLAVHKRVLAVDRQAYAATLASAMLRGNEAHAAFARSPRFQRTYKDAQSMIAGAFDPLLRLEESAIDEAIRGFPALLSSITDEGGVVAFCGGAEISDERTRKALHETRSRLHRAKLAPGFATAATYFGGPYFSYRQAISLDALAAAIAESPEEYRDLLRGILLSVASHVVSTVGKQFAQPMRLIKKSGSVQSLLLKRALRDRAFDVLDIYLDWAERWAAAVLRRSPFPHLAHRGDAAAAIEESIIAADVYYADPPYTIDHYSRFYHVLETLTLRDEPSLEKGPKGTIMRGLYRGDRYQSPFCIPSQVTQAFSALFASISQTSKPLLLSYSSFNSASNHRPRLVEIDALRRLAARYFSDVTVIESSPHSHRKLNLKELNVEPATSAERFVVCRGKRG
jgi:adenine-specific DNA-methyltransferase